MGLVPKTGIQEGLWIIISLPDNNAFMIGMDGQHWAKNNAKKLNGNGWLEKGER